MVSEVQDVHVSRGTGYQRAKQVFWDLYMHAHGMRNSDQILNDDRTILEENFTVLTTSPALAKKFLTGMLTSGLSLVANLLVQIVILLHPCYQEIAICVTVMINICLLELKKHNGSVLKLLALMMLLF